MMAEVVKPTGDPVVTPLDEALPGGFKTVEEMYAALQTVKTDLADNKTRKTTNTALQTELDQFKQADADRITANQTELERALSEVDTLKSSALQSVAELNKAHMNTLFERVLSGRLAGMDENSRKLMRMHYNSAVVSSEGFTDEDSLTAILDPVDELLKGMTSTDGTTVIMQGGSTQVGKDQKAPGGFFKQFSGMTSIERLKFARDKKKG